MRIVEDPGQLKSMDRMGLIDIIRRYMAFEEKMELLEKERSEAQTAMSREYHALKEKLAACQEKIRTLEAQLKHAAEKNSAMAKERFGRHTEKTADLLSSAPVQEEEDEAAREPESREQDCPGSCGGEKAAANRKKRPHGTKAIGKRDRDLAGLPCVNIFELDPDALDALYGAGNWRIAHWRRHRRLGYQPEAVFVEYRYTPVLSIGLEHVMEEALPGPVLMKNSLATPGLAAKILYDKFFLGLPVYRQSQHLHALGVELSRQTMTNWIINLSLAVFGPLWDRLKELVTMAEYQQCDETTLTVNKDGRKAGRKSYMWCHITGELLDMPPVILFCFELTRSADHLREFYSALEKAVFLTSDAYSAYFTLERESGGKVSICGCFMHLRRRFADALSLLPLATLSPDEIERLPELKALDAVAAIYYEENQLKGLDADGRKRGREAVVAPLFDAFYELISGPEYQGADISGKLRDAVEYANNQKEYLGRFLHDGNIPIDDGQTERAIRPFATGRKGWLFSDSIIGAQAMAIMYSIVRTASANKANVLCYLRYVLEEMPRHLSGTDFSFLDDMMPWSEKYRRYEESQAQAPSCYIYKENEYASPPKPPPKKNGSGRTGQNSDRDSVA